MNEIINEWRKVFWHPKRQAITLENSSLIFQGISALSDQFLHSIEYDSTLTEREI